jgi:hypothetical protein
MDCVVDIGLLLADSIHLLHLIGPRGVLDIINDGTLRPV